MIKILFPQDESALYLRIENRFWGPLQVPGEAPFSFVPIRSDLDSISNGKEFWGEKDVDHKKVDADLLFNPALSDAIYNPTPAYPHRIKMLFSTAGVNPVYQEAIGGIVETRHVAKSTGVSTVLDDVSPTHFTKWAASYISSSGQLTRVDVVRVRYTLLGFTPGKKNSLRYQSDTESSRKTWPRGQGPPFEGIFVKSILEGWFSSGTSLPRSLVVSDGPTLVWKGQMNASVGYLRNHILPAIIHHPDGFISSDIDDFGTMASRAVSKMDKTSSNMLEFISELRKPAKLIPKLKNLEKLKGWSEEYLRTQYGILPTISDLQNIIGMFRGAKPYFDKNGFSTYHAGSRTNSTLEGRSYDHSRQIKVATQAEENGLLALMNRIDEIGFAPDFANLWDLIPFSFVLDWFVDVGSMLERIDMNSRIARLNIPYVTMSEKKQVFAAIQHSNKVPFTGTLEVVSYQRWTTGRCPTPPLLLESDTARQPQNQWLEASALIVSLKK